MKKILFLSLLLLGSVSQSYAMLEGTHIAVAGEEEVYAQDTDGRIYKYDVNLRKKTTFVLFNNEPMYRGTHIVFEGRYFCAQGVDGKIYMYGPYDKKEYLLFNNEPMIFGTHIVFRNGKVCAQGVDGKIYVCDPFNNYDTKVLFNDKKMLEGTHIDAN